MALPVLFLISAGLQGAGTAQQVSGIRQSTRAGVEASLNNASALRSQAEFMRRQNEREQELFKKATDMQLGQQVSAFAKAGVDLSGSPLLVVSQQQLARGRELADIKAAGDFRVDQILRRADSMVAQADQIRRAGRGKMMSSILTGAAGIGGSAASISSAGQPRRLSGGSGG